jgi:hypothetical protein
MITFARLPRHHSPNVFYRHVTEKISYKSDSRRSLPKRSSKNEAKDPALLACTHGPGPGKPQTSGVYTYSPVTVTPGCLGPENRSTGAWCPRVAPSNARFPIGDERNVCEMKRSSPFICRSGLQLDENKLQDSTVMESLGVGRIYSSIYHRKLQPSRCRPIDFGEIGMSGYLDRQQHM